MPQTDPRKEKTVARNVLDFIVELTGTLIYQLLLWAVAAAVVVGIVAVTFGVSLTSALWIIGGFGVAMFMWYMFVTGNS